MHQFLVGSITFYYRLWSSFVKGYGQSGPYREAPGYDVIIEAEAGLMHMYAFRYHLHIEYIFTNLYPAPVNQIAPPAKSV